MTNSDWTGERLGDGPVVVSADWDDGRPMTWEMAVHASVGPDHRPVRVPCDRLADFLTAHEAAPFVSRDVVEIAAPLLVRGSTPDSKGVTEAVAERTKAATWIDMGRLLQTVVDQHCRFAEKLDEPAMLALDQLLGTKGLGVLVGVLEGLQRTTAAFKQRVMDRSIDHRTIATVFAVLTPLAAALEADAHPNTRENADPVPHADDGEENESQVDAEQSPTSASRPTAINCSPLGNRIGVWAAVVGRHLDLAELAVDTGAVTGFRRALDANWKVAWGRAGRYNGLQACFAVEDKAPIRERLTDWLATTVEKLVDDDRAEFSPPPLSEPPTLEDWGLWGGAWPDVATCRELLRCHALTNFLGDCQNERLTGTHGRPFAIYRRLKAVTSRPLFVPRPRRHLWVVRPYAPKLHALSAVLDARGNHGVIPRLPFLLQATTADRGEGDAYTQIAAGLAWHGESRPPNHVSSGGDGEAAEQFVREFVRRLERPDAESMRWVATARGLLDTAAFGVDLDILRRVLDEDFGVGHRAAELRHLRSMLSTHVLPELAGYWENSRVWMAARRLGLPDEEVYVRLRDQVRSVADQFKTGQRQPWEVRETLGHQLMKDVVKGGEGRVVQVLERMTGVDRKATSITVPDRLRSLMLTRTLTPGRRVVGPAYPAEVRRREYDLACEELTLGIAHELIADGFGVVAVTPDEILLEGMPGQVKPDQVRTSADAGAYRVLGRHAGPAEVQQVAGW